MLFLLSIVLVSIIEYVGDSNFKFFARTNNYTNLAIGIVAYIFMVAAIILILKHTNVMYLNGAWDGISALIETILAFVLLHETLSNRYQYIGLAFVILGIFGLAYGKIPEN